jgi:membrane-bound lytic murein transglycosylase B
MRFAAVLGPLVVILTVHTAGLASQDAPQPSFAEWLAGVRSEALGLGIRQETVDRAFQGLNQPLRVVVERDRAQPEVVQSLETYVARRVTPAAVRTGKQMLARHRAVLDKVSEQYGVPVSIMVSIWGLESNFGRFTGVRPTVGALATLAWEGRRAEFFRKELFDALTILDRGDIELAHMRGSWAGAMGQPQFMPSSYLRYAVDFDGDGRRDIWRSSADIFASVANYLKGYGWVTGQAWGLEVDLSPEVGGRIAAEVSRRSGMCRAKNDMSIALSLEEWQHLGVKLPNGGTLPLDGPPAFLVSGASKHFLVHDNYDVLLGYNCAHAYAVSVATLAERLGS